MDLVTTVRKEGSRGGRDAFTWESVKSDAHRENYLGHSLMAPVGRWQAKRDLNWYAKGDADPSSAQKEEDARREEIRRIKEAEEDALSAALGLPVAPRREQAPSAIEKGEVDRVLKDVVGSGMGEDDGGVETGLGYGQYGGRGTGADNVLVRTQNFTDQSKTQEGGLQGEFKKREKRERRRSRSRNQEREKERRHKWRHEEEEGRHRRRKSRSRSRDEYRRRRSTSRSNGYRRRSRSREVGRRRDHSYYERRRERSRSPKHRKRAYSRDRYRHD